MEEEVKEIKSEAQVEEIKSVEPTTKEGLLKKFPKGKGKETFLLILGVFFVVAIGIGTGWLLSGKSSGQKSTGPASVSSETKDGKTEAGIADEEAFPDSAEGILLEGGIDGEGTHHLDRGLGPKKDVYLTSTVINLDDFKDKKVQVWGETISAQKAGWLMDVGRIKVID